MRERYHDTVSARETGGNDTSDDPAYTLTEIDVDTSGSGRTGNDLAGTYILLASDTILTTFTESAADASGSYVLSKNLSVSQLNDETGNAITGDYTVDFLTTESTETDIESDTFAGGTDIITNTRFDSVLQEQTGNHIIGTYSLTDADLHSTNFDETGANAAGSFTLVEATSGTSLGSETGNEIGGAYTTTDTTTDGYQATETVSGDAASFSLVETGDDTVTASAVGNSVIGNLNQYDAVADSYTMTETGTQVGGAFSEVVTGSDTYRDQQTGAPEQGNSSVYETGSGNYNLTDSGAGATLPSGPGSLAYTLSETYSSLNGGTSLTTVTGADRYSLLEQWQDLSASGLGGGAGVGTAEFQPVGAPVAMAGWWNTPLTTKDGDPYAGSSGSSDSGTMAGLGYFDNLPAPAATGASIYITNTDPAQAQKALEQFVGFAQNALAVINEVRESSGLAPLQLGGTAADEMLANGSLENYRLRTQGEGSFNREALAAVAAYYSSQGGEQGKALAETFGAAAYGGSNHYLTLNPDGQSLQVQRENVTIESAYERIANGRLGASVKQSLDQAGLWSWVGTFAGGATNRGLGFVVGLSQLPHIGIDALQAVGHWGSVAANWASGDLVPVYQPTMISEYGKASQQAGSAGARYHMWLDASVNLISFGVYERTQSLIRAIQSDKEGSVTNWLGETSVDAVGWLMLGKARYNEAAGASAVDEINVGGRRWGAAADEINAGGRRWGAAADEINAGGRRWGAAADEINSGGRGWGAAADEGIAPQSGVRGYLKNLRSYWERSTGGLTQEEATALAKREGFGFEIGRQSRFENARDSVVIGRGNLQEGLVNRMELAEEIQHGLDRATHQASRAIRRGLSNEEFHAEHFERILEQHRAGGHQFLTPEDIKAFQEAIKELRGR